MQFIARLGGAWRAVRIAAPAMIGCIAVTFAAHAQLVPHIINQNQLGQPVAPVITKHQPTAHASARVAAAANIPPFRLLTVRAEGGAVLPVPALVATWRRYLGATVSNQQLSAILNAIGQLCQKQNLALYAISLPAQNFAGGVLVIRIVAGHVGSVSIEGDTKGADLRLLKQYAAHIIVDRPLHRATLERNVLLMQTIPGLTVGSALHPVPGQPGAEQLQLAVVRKPIQGGFAVNNQGDPQLDIVQATANLTINGLFREGEKDQLVFGAPLTLRRYQYYGLLHQEPIGSNGDTLTFNAGDLVTNPVGEVNSGSAQIASLIFADPLISTVTRNLTASVEADYLNSNEALLGYSISKERTRTLRASLSFARAGDLAGIDDGSVTLAQGVNVLGAKRGSIVYGAPSFTKFSASLARLQLLPAGFIFTVRATGQFTPDHLPASEQFLFGGQQFGQAYDVATMAGDRGVAAAGEISHPIPMFHELPPVLISGLAGFGFADWGRVWNIDTPYQVASDAAASAGAGIRFTALRKVTLSLAAASQLNKPEEEGRLQPWRCVFTVSGRF